METKRITIYKPTRDALAAAHEQTGLDDLARLVDEYDRTPAAPEDEFTLWPGPDERGIEAWPDIAREVWEKLLMWVDLSEGLDRSTRIAQVSIYFEHADEKGSGV
jgi:hypothetical protein